MKKSSKTAASEPKPERKHPELTLLKRNESKHPANPEQAKLETFENAYPKRPYTIVFDCPEFTSLCPVTGQPDFGHITISYVPGRRCVESKSLKLYLFSYRNHNTFHEEAVNAILEDLVKACAPRWMEVKGDFRPRGGIAICVVARSGKQPRN